MKRVIEAIRTIVFMAAPILPSLDGVDVKWIMDRLVPITDVIMAMRRSESILVSDCRYMKLARKKMLRIAQVKPVVAQMFVVSSFFSSMDCLVV